MTKLQTWGCRNRISEVLRHTFVQLAVVFACALPPVQTVGSTSEPCSGLCHSGEYKERNCESGDEIYWGQLQDVAILRTATIAKKYDKWICRVSMKQCWFIEASAPSMYWQSRIHTFIEASAPSIYWQSRIHTFIEASAPSMYWQSRIHTFIESSAPSIYW
jgi:hypothetical protein